MEMFVENFRGGNEIIMCPLCRLHPDNQENSLNCPETRKETEIKGNLCDIFKENIGTGIVETLTKIVEIRK